MQVDLLVIANLLQRLSVDDLEELEVRLNGNALGDGGSLDDCPCDMMFSEFDFLVVDLHNDVVVRMVFVFPGMMVVFMLIAVMMGIMSLVVVMFMLTMAVAVFRRLLMLILNGFHPYAPPVGTSLADPIRTTKQRSRQTIF